MKSCFGKYRGKVENNIDPMLMGRVQISAPSVLGEGTFSWAMPCVPYAGPGVGFFAIPPVGANIWVEFEGGDPDYPIWSGCFWGMTEAPAKPALAEIKVFKTECITLTLSDLPGAGGFTVEVEPPAVATPIKMVFDTMGVEIDASPANIKMSKTGIEMTLTPASLKLSPSSIEISHSPGLVKVSPSDVEITSGPSTSKVSSEGIEMTSGPATSKIASGGIELSNGSASVKLSPASVSINDGALEVM